MTAADRAERLDRLVGWYETLSPATGEAMLRWEPRFRHRALGKAEQNIASSSLLRFDAGGQVALHRDYWDAAEELWAKLPLIGFLTRRLRRQFASP
jgi:steroid delta-isomerase